MFIGSDWRKMHRWEPRNPPDSSMRVTHSKLSSKPNEDKCNIYFTNFPDEWEACHFWNIFKAHGDVIDVHIPVKRNSKGHRFGFICFMFIDDISSLLLSLNQIWIGSFKLRFYIARGLKGTVERQKRFQPTNCSLNSSKNEIPQHSKSYAEAVKGVNDSPKNISVKKRPLNINVGVSSDSKLPKVEIKSGANVIKESESSFTSNHVDICMDNGVLVIKINFQELLGALNSDSEDSQSTTDRNKSISANGPKIFELPLAICTKATNINPISLPTSSIIVKPCRKRLKSFNFPFGSVFSRSLNNPFLSSLLPSGKQLQVAQCSPSMQSSSSQDYSEASNADLDRGKSCSVLNDGNELGSPCISINTRSFDDFNLPCGADYNINEVSGEFDDYGESHLNDNTGLEVVSKENESIDDRSPTTSVNSVAEHIMDNDNDLDDDMEDELICANSAKIKKP